MEKVINGCERILLYKSLLSSLIVKLITKQEMLEIITYI